MKVRRDLARRAIDRLAGSLGMDPLTTADGIIAVVTAGSAVDISAVGLYADAIILAWYPGEQGGNALADLLFGKISPSGHLPVTFYRSLSDLPSYRDYGMKGRTYRYMTAEPLYPFGFGLSYTTFGYSDLRVSKVRMSRNETVVVGATIINTGKIVSDEVAELYLTHEGANDSEPLFALKGFQRVSLAPGASAIPRLRDTART